MLNLTGLTEVERAAAKWQYDMHGDFYTTLFKAIMQADERNLQRLSAGFPIEVEAYRLYMHEAGWWVKVEAKLRNNLPA